MPAAPSYVANIQPQFFGAVGSGSFTFSTISGANRFGVLWFHMGFGSGGSVSNYITACDISGVALSRIGGFAVGGGRGLEAWGAVAVPTGAAVAAFTQNGGNGGPIDMCGVVYQDVDQTVPYSGFSSNFEPTSPTALAGVTIPSAIGCTTIDFCTDTDPASNGAAITNPSTYLSAGAVKRFGFGGGPIPVGSDCPGAASITTEWTLAAGAFWACLGISLNPVSAGGDTLMGQICL